MSLPPQVKGVDSFGSRTSRENSPRSTLDLNQDQERSPTSDLNPHLEEESVMATPLTSVKRQKYVVVTILQSLIAMFRKRERNLCFGGIQIETAESAGQTASRLEASLQLTSELIASYVQTQGKSSPRHAIRTPGKQIGHSMKRSRIFIKSSYKIGQMDSLRAGYNQLWIHNTGLNDKLRASEFEISELRKKNEALKTILDKVLSNDGNGGKRDGDMAGSDIHVSVSPTGPAKKRGKFE
ncbi:hypothetical protein V493_01575 [Pseudogymnoascus sp. VKM F-4281 (FW-2241)]|nr:hypothetical protein V493_01575 [Pseudogymnoascus sp. VKM F-4281 (FW-2241)]